MTTLLHKTKSDDSPMLLRLLFYGAPKTRKTWLAGTAAEAGFNVILLDADHGYHILTKQLSEKAMKRVNLIECRDSLGQAHAAMFLGKFLKSGKVYFNEQTRTPVFAASKIDENCIELNATKHLTKNTVLIIDSYTAFIRSIQFRYAIEQKIDLTDAQKEDWEGYGWSGRLASSFIERLTKLPCHVIMIGHQSVYEKRSKDGKTIEWTRMQLKSTSGPHAMTIGDSFSDILHFRNTSSIMTKIDTRADKDRDGGCRVIPPADYKWEDLSFKKICEFAGIQLPPENLFYLDMKPTPPKGGLTETKPAINTKPQATKLSGLSILKSK